MSAVLLEDFSGAAIRTTDDETIALWSPYTGVNPDQVGSLDTVNHLYQIAVGPSARYTGTSSGGNAAATLNDAAKNWTGVVFADLGGAQTVHIKTGTGAGQFRYISGPNSATQIGIFPDWDTVPDATSTYEINYTTGGYLNFFPNGLVDQYQDPHGYMRNYVKSGTFEPTCNQLWFWVRASKRITRRSDGGDIVQIGTYLRQVTETNGLFQGAHGYHGLDANFYADRWMRVGMTRKPTHYVGQLSTIDWPDDPEFVIDPSKSLPHVSENGLTPTPEHYFRILGRWYWDHAYANAVNYGEGYSLTWTFGSFTFEADPDSPDTLVSNTTCTHNGTAYELTWATPKMSTQVYEVIHGPSPLKAPDGSWNGAGTLSGATVAGADSLYTSLLWTSPAMADQATYYLGIRPQGQALVHQIAMSPGPGAAPPDPSPVKSRRKGGGGGRPGSRSSTPSRPSL